MLQVKTQPAEACGKVPVGSATPYLFLIYMLLLEDATYASSVIETYVILIILKLCCFTHRIFKLDNILLFVNLIVNIISAATPCM